MNQLENKPLEFRDLVQTTANDLYQSVINYLPNLVGAIIVFVIGLVVASIIRGVLRRVFKELKLDGYAQRGGLNKILTRGGISTSISEILVGVVFWIILLVFLIPTLRILGLVVVSSIINDLLTYLPKVAAAIVILTAGVFAARVIRDIVSTAVGQIDVGYSLVAGSVSQTVTVLFVLVLAANQLGIDTTIVTANISIVIAGVMLAFGISVGLGAKDIVGNLVSSYYVRQLINRGDEIAVGGVKGKVEKVETTTVLISTKEGKVSVPTKEFMGKTTQFKG